MGLRAGMAVCATAVAVLLSFATSSARSTPATYPGANGKIVLVRKTPPCTGGDSPICKFTVWVINPDGSGLRRLTKGLCDSVPTWSRDGRRIAYVYVEGRGCTRPAIWVMGANGSGKRRLGFANMDLRLPEPVVVAGRAGDPVRRRPDEEAGEQHRLRPIGGQQPERRQPQSQDAVWRPA
jgi:dipeptidyl aminopeptidase/acylaminoacyl peptidase